jgi:hypothetical protein
VSFGPDADAALAWLLANTPTVRVEQCAEVNVACRLPVVAAHVRDLAGSRGHAALYRLSRPVWSNAGLTEYVVVSAINDELLHETLIFGSTADAVVDWSEIDGLRGTTDHVRAINSAGWVSAGAVEASAEPLDAWCTWADEVAFAEVVGG